MCLQLCHACVVCMCWGKDEIGVDVVIRGWGRRTQHFRLLLACERVAPCERSPLLSR